MSAFALPREQKAVEDQNTPCHPERRRGICQSSTKQAEQSFLGSSLYYLSISRELIRNRVGRIVKLTSIRRSKSWGYESSDDYFNQILVVESELTPLDLLDVIEQIERDLGRNKQPCNWRGARLYEDRLIDIDILYYGDIEYEDDRLKIPHPKMNDRDFVQVLLGELGELGEL